MKPWMEGFRDLGHDVYFVEKAGYEQACFDPERGVMGNDSSYGLSMVSSFFREFDLEDRWCFVDWEGNYHGLSRSGIERRFRSADLYIDMGGLGFWRSEAEDTDVTVLLDLDPTFTQIERIKRGQGGEQTGNDYDYFYTVGKNVATGEASTPADDTRWRGIYNPVCVDRFDGSTIDPDRPFSTVMNWKSYDPVEYNGVTYGNKDREFPRFLELPGLVSGRLQVAVAGLTVPRKRLTEAGWEVRDAQRVTRTFDSFRDYIDSSIGEFSVCKHGYVEPKTGWFSDRSATYLAMGRPVVLQETGFSSHLPCGEGLFAVEDPQEAAAALDTIRSSPKHHARQAREIARAHLSAPEVLSSLLDEVRAGR